MQRRDFLKSASGAGLIILRSGALRGQNAPSNRLNIALIGVWGRGTAHYNVLHGENVVALCDVNDKNLKAAAEKHPNAKTFNDFRELFDDKTVKTFDACVISTCEHTHAFATLPALQARKHVYCEKPLTHGVWEARVIQEAAKGSQRTLAWTWAT